MDIWVALHYIRRLPSPSAHLLHIDSVITLVPDSVSKHNVRLYVIFTMYAISSVPVVY